jgi:hypothetical protein
MKELSKWIDPTAWSTWLRTAIDPVILPFAVMFGLVLAATAIGFFALSRAKAVAREARERAQEDRESAAAALASVREAVNTLAIQVQEARRMASTVPAAPKPGFNLSKRSHALRMHRRGEAPDRIASELDLPVQEVDLLLKVHRIVISNL